jgi:hypothetical protein
MLESLIKTQFCVMQYRNCKQSQNKYGCILAKHLNSEPVAKSCQRATVIRPITTLCNQTVSSNSRPQLSCFLSSHSLPSQYRRYSNTRQILEGHPLVIRWSNFLDIQSTFCVNPCSLVEALLVIHLESSTTSEYNQNRDRQLNPIATLAMSSTIEDVVSADKSPVSADI